MLPIWVVSDQVYPAEQRCPHWTEYLIREKMLTAGVPAYLTEKSYEPSPPDEDLLEKLRKCFDHRAILGVVGKENPRIHALVTMTRYLACQRKTKWFRVEMFNLDFRARLKNKDEMSPLVELMNYQWLLFMVCADLDLPEWMMTEMKRLLVHRGLHRLPTVVIDSDSELLKHLRGMGEVIGCQI